MTKAPKPVGLNGRANGITSAPAASESPPEQMGRDAINSVSTTPRMLHFPNDLYYDMKDENTLVKRSGIKRTTEQEIFSLLADGLRLRRLLRAKNRKDILTVITLEEHEQLQNKLAL